MGYTMVLQGSRYGIAAWWGGATACANTSQYKTARRFYVNRSAGHSFLAPTRAVTNCAMPWVTTLQHCSSLSHTRARRFCKSTGCSAGRTGTPLGLRAVPWSACRPSRSRPNNEPPHQNWPRANRHVGRGAKKRGRSSEKREDCKAAGINDILEG